jgi:endoglucanase
MPQAKMCRSGLLFSLISILVLALLAFLGPACRPDPLADLERVLTVSWQSYRQTFISTEGRVVIPDQDRGTISEGQAYAMLRAVWAGDEATFGLVHAWTQRHLSRSPGPGDHLLSWSWGRRPDGSWGLKDANTASDGNLDYALALVLAARRGWRAPPDLPDYLEEARQVMGAILEKRR